MLEVTEDTLVLPSAPVQQVAIVQLKTGMKKGRHVLNMTVSHTCMFVYLHHFICEAMLEVFTE